MSCCPHTLCACVYVCVREFLCVEYVSVFVSTFESMSGSVEHQRLHHLCVGVYACVCVCKVCVVSTFESTSASFEQLPRTICVCVL